MITRLDDELHSRLKAQAAVEGRSLNELVVWALTTVLDSSTSRRAVRERARSTGRLVVPEAPLVRPRHVEAETRGFGDAVSTALDEERSQR